MKRFITFCFLLSCLHVGAQEDSSYTAMLQTTEEVQLGDSLQIDAVQWKLRRLDSVDVKKWFSPILGTTTNNRLKNRGYYLGGKFTTNKNFDLLVLLEEKKKKDTSNSAVQVIYFITTKKDGKFIASLEVAVTGVKKKTTYNTTSWLYRDFKILKDSEFIINEKPFNDLAVYKISGGGRFILYPNY